MAVVASKPQPHDHPWWLDVMHKGVLYRMLVDDFAFARGATASVSSKQEAEKVWEPKFIAEIASGKDPRLVPDRKAPSDGPATVAALLTLYRDRYDECSRQLLGGVDAPGSRAARQSSGTGERRYRSGGVNECERTCIGAFPIVSHLSADNGSPSAR